MGRINVNPHLFPIVIDVCISLEAPLCQGRAIKMAVNLLEGSNMVQAVLP